MPRVKVLNYLKKVALFFRFERYFTCACPTIATRASSAVMMACLFIVLLYLDTKYEEMRYRFHNVRREVGFDEAVAAKTASPIFRLVPIRAIQDERNELSFL